MEHSCGSLGGQERDDASCNSDCTASGRHPRAECRTRRNNPRSIGEEQPYDGMRETVLSSRLKVLLEMLMTSQTPAGWHRAGVAVCGIRKFMRPAVGRAEQRAARGIDQSRLQTIPTRAR